MATSLLSQIGGAVQRSLEMYLGSGGAKGNALRVRQLLIEAGTELCAAVAADHVVTALFSTREGSSRHVRLLRVSIGIGIRDEIRFRRAIAEDEKAYRYNRQLLDGSGHASAKARKKFLERVEVDRNNEWDRRDCYILGALVLDHFLTHSEIIEVVQEWQHPAGDLRRKSKPAAILRFTAEADAKILAAADKIASRAIAFLPMEEPPLDWAPDAIGGYRGIPLGSLGCLMSSSKAEQREAFEQSNCPEVYQAVNTIQRTPWRINRRVFECLQIAKTHRWPELKLVTDPLPFPSPPEHEWTKGDPAWMDYRRQKFEHHRSEEEFRRDTLDLAKTVSVCDILTPYDRFYFPHFLDFRGRAYPRSGRLSYQGPDYQRACLEFADGKPVDSPEALEWLRVHGANCFGFDKVPTAERDAWVQENTRKILAVAQDPIDCRWWTDAEKPFCFLAFCFDYAAFLKDPRGHLSHLPVCMDGSNNGLQVYSLLLRDEIGGLATNCTPSPRVHDIYQDVADVATRKLREIAQGSDSKRAGNAREFLQFCKDRGLDGLPRKAVKRPVMTLPYGATRYSCQRYLAEWYHGYVRGLSLHGDELPFRNGDSYQILYYIGTVVWEAIGEVVVKAREGMRWLQGAARKVSEEGTHIQWTTPLGMVCQQRYVRGKTKRTKLYSKGKWLKLQYWLDDGEVKSGKSVSGFCPNFVHSLDASVMMRTVNWASEAGVTHLQMVHDSFGTHAMDAPALATALREAAVSLFRTDQLAWLRDQIQQQLPHGAALEPLPEYGSLSIDALKDAEYFFH
jgi:DNA-directed RNA polymerase, mitochondrial